MNGVDLPHDCRSGICGACRVRLVDGKVFGGTEEGSDMIHACQARIVSDLKLATEAGARYRSRCRRAWPASIRLAPDVIGVIDRTAEAARISCPANIASCSFAASRSAATARPIRSKARPIADLLHFHIRRFPDGAGVLGARRSDIRVGHRVRLTGPFGRAFFRPNHPGRIVLVASGTGFAPMWSIAAAAITEQPQRELIFVVAARKLQSFYMHAALCRLALFPNVTIIPVVSEPQNVSPAIRSGRPTDYLPQLSADDVVYTSGAPAMTDEVARIARAAGAVCYTDPFVPNAKAAEPAEADGAVVRRAGRSRKDSSVAEVA